MLLFTLGELALLVKLHNINLSVINLNRNNYNNFDFAVDTIGSKSYQRPQSVTSKEASMSVINSNIDRIDEEDIKKLRFSRHVSAFDIDLDALDEQPWRNRNVDLLDYFNYGFNERTWKVKFLFWLLLLLLLYYI